MPTAAEPDWAGIDASQWSEDGLEVQLRMAWLRSRTPPDLGFDPGTTPWHPMAWSPSQAEFSDPDAPQTPGELLLLLSRELGFGGDLGRELWEQTVRIHEDGDGGAVGVILRWGFMDDSVVGHDLRARMGEQNGVWRVLGLEERFHCSRGVSGGGFCR